MNSVIIAIATILILSGALAPTALASTYGYSKSCSSEEYTIGFFNGVWNTRKEAFASTALLIRETGIFLNGEDLYHDTFYNHTGEAVGATALQDIAEVVMQKAKENNFDLGEHFEVFWSAFSGESNNLISKMVNIADKTIALPLNIAEEIYTTVTIESAAAISKMMSSPPNHSRL
jgi:hypothetical protein